MDREAETPGGVEKQFIKAVHESIGFHCAGVLKHVPHEELDRLNIEDVVLMLGQYVLQDVMDLGLQIMCWKHVGDTVHKSVAGVVEDQRRRMDEGATEVQREDEDPDL